MAKPTHRVARKTCFNSMCDLLQSSDHLFMCVQICKGPGGELGQEESKMKT